MAEPIVKSICSFDFQIKVAAGTDAGVKQILPVKSIAGQAKTGV